MALPVFRLFGSPESRPASTDGRIVYAVGDVHGRLDLLDPLLDQIRRDAFTTPNPAKPVLIFLGDYVDRGASSKGVIDRVIALKAGSEFEVRALKGNHEEALLAFLEDADFGLVWCAQGGARTLSSYGVTAPAPDMDARDWRGTREAFAAALPLAHWGFLAGLELTAVYGDYLFVHAGVRPGVALSEQSEHDLLWIRREFLNADRPSEKIVVHGHTPTQDAFLGEHRIGIDTGAYATGVLTAVRLYDADRRLIQSRPRD
jgi:serine/threonine protein phosphatase 1